MTPFEVYTTYLSVKNHFTKDKYDYHKYCGKTNASIQSFYKRKDRYWFEKLSRQKDEKEVINFFVSNFVQSQDPNSLWIGDIIRNGESIYCSWKKRNQSLSYVFSNEVKILLGEFNIESLFDCSSGHPPILKKYLDGSICLETVVIIDKILYFTKDFNKKMSDDPVWGLISKIIKKYDPFINIDIFKYRKIIKDCVI